MRNVSLYSWKRLVNGNSVLQPESKAVFFMVKCSTLSPELRNKLEETVVASVTIVPKSCLWRKEWNSQNKNQKKNKAKHQKMK